jgi:hypothetical protein
MYASESQKQGYLQMLREKENYDLPSFLQRELVPLSVITSEEVNLQQYTAHPPASSPKIL